MGESKYGKLEQDKEKSIYQKHNITKRSRKKNG